MTDQVASEDELVDCAQENSQHNIRVRYGGDLEGAIPATHLIFHSDVDVAAFCTELLFQ